MINTSRFAEVISTEEQLREIIGHPHEITVRKTQHAIDEYIREFIAQSPFLLIASSNAQGSVDVSPKGDPPGFVRVLDDKTLLIPDRPGNRRADTFTNILQNPKVGLFFLIPGKSDTLRVSGQATIVRDEDLRMQMAERGKVPQLIIAVHVEEAFFHCTKCIVRSALWNPAAWPDLEGKSTFAHALIKHCKLDDTLEEVKAMIAEDEQDGLY